MTHSPRFKEFPVVVPFKLTVCGVSELEGFSRAGVSHVLSVLDPNRPDPEVLRGFDPHDRLLMRFDDIIEEIPGYEAPQPHHIERLLDFGTTMDVDPRPTHLLVHCHMGVSRSTASMILLLAQARPDIAARTIADEVVRIRPQAWPNLRMIRFGDKILGREGELVDAVRGIYRNRAALVPETVTLIRGAGRLAELEGIEVKAL